jgi:hypothetical protein
MLSSISWQHYLAAVIILTVSYYAYVVLRYYQNEIASFFNRKPELDSFSGFSSSAVSVMGKARPDDGVSVSDTGELSFADVLPDEPVQVAVNNSRKEPELPEPADELVQEAGKLTEAFKDIDNKPEFLTLLRILIDSYKRFQDDIDLPAALTHIRENANAKLKFPVTATDLQGSWE